jgi:hypothetical protein
MHTLDADKAEKAYQAADDGEDGGNRQTGSAGHADLGHGDIGLGDMRHGKLLAEALGLLAVNGVVVHKFFLIFMLFIVLLLGIRLALGVAFLITALHIDGVELFFKIFRVVNSLDKVAAVGANAGSIIQLLTAI